jgi:hypothetical protein
MIHEAGLALHQADDAMLAGVVAHDRVHLPVAGLFACFDLRRSVADHLLSCQTPSAVVLPVSLAPALGRTPQVHPQGAAGLLVPPDVLVDGLVADPQQANLA